MNCNKIIDFVKRSFYTYILFLYLYSDSDKGNYVVKLTFAILGPMIALVVAGGILFCLLAHRTRRKRPISRRNKLILDPDNEPSMLHFSFSSPTSSATCHPHELRATAAGDSTLKVHNATFLFFYVLYKACVIYDD